MLSSKESPLQVLKTLYDKPNMATEISYKLKTDANNGFLLNSQEFLRFPKDIKRIRNNCNQQQDKGKGSFQKQEINSPYYN